MVVVLVVAFDSGGFGPRQRYRSASREAWQSVEYWAGFELPSDYKHFVDGFGDAVIFKHLFVAHPEGFDPLLNLMKEERKSFLAGFEDLPDETPAASVGAGRFLPWAYHDFNGDICLLVPPSGGSGDWAVAVSFRQCPEVQVFSGGVTQFLQGLADGEFPRGWPRAGFEWAGVEGSPLI
ncbi:SMI1/KNR4 family protein [Streptomyces sp. WM6372]|uniref:SMI1/KNR4 family protein n=1 Tax=Streptomyces sp. WM6372 TaxID=1415555 RepID=UPI00099B88E5|nr:SMI1/KNR4 family protein [Streptomyces sp. WM6372]